MELALLPLNLAACMLGWSLYDICFKPDRRSRAFRRASLCVLVIWLQLFQLHLRLVQHRGRPHLIQPGPTPPAGNSSSALARDERQVTELPSTSR
jgi:hypothetical protein